jgi:hypothetical protein
MESDSGGDNTGVASDPSFPRPLQPAEAAALRDLIERAEVPQMDVLLAQVDVAQAVGGCECPCPMISLTVDAERAVPVSYTATPIATAQYDDGGVMVWVEDGWLSHFELYWLVHRRGAAFDVPSARGHVRPPGDDCRFGGKRHAAASAGRLTAGRDRRAEGGPTTRLLGRRPPAVGSAS